MIGARFDFEALAASLTGKARRLADARRDSARLGRDDERRWRQAELLWPLFTKG